MKKNYGLTLDIEAIETLKNKKEFNLSQFVSNILRVEAGLPTEKDDILINLKLTNAKLITELGNSNAIIGQKDREITELKAKIEELRQKSQKNEQKQGEVVWRSQKII